MDKLVVGLALELERAKVVQDFRHLGRGVLAQFRDLRLSFDFSHQLRPITVPDIFEVLPGKFSNFKAFNSVTH